MKKHILILTLLISNVFFAQKIASGLRHNVIIKNDGTLWAWGDNYRLQIGNGSRDAGNGIRGSQYNPIQIGTDSDWKLVAAGAVHTVAIKNNGTLWGWGYNASGQCGQLVEWNTGVINVPTQIGTSSDWKLVDAGESHTVAIKNDGTLWAWGDNAVGQLGNGNAINNDINRYTPTQVGTDSDWKLASAGGSSSTFAIKNDGTLWAWGGNANGELGDGTVTDYQYSQFNPNFMHNTTPKKIGVSTDWKLVVPGIGHVMAFKNNGTLWAWGANGFGQLGDGAITDKRIPTQIGTDTDWKIVASGSGHTKAIKNNGSLWAWGEYHRLGDGTLTSKNTPIQIGNETNWNSLDIGFDQTLASKNDCELMIWGYYSIETNSNTYVRDLYFTNYTKPKSYCGNPPSGQTVQTFCSIKRIADLVVSGTSIKWYPTESCTEAPLDNNYFLESGKTYYASQTINSYENAILFPVKAVIISASAPTGSYYQNNCSNATIADLSATGTEIKWYASQSGGIALTSTTPLVNGNIYYASQTISGCESIGRKSVQFSIRDIATPTGSSTQTFCSGVTIASLVATGTEIRWYSTVTGGTALANTTSLVNGNTYYASQTLNSCESSTRLAVTVNVTNTATPSGGSIQNLEIGSTVSNIVVSGSAIKWYTSATGGTALNNTTALQNDGIYYASQTLNSCESQSRLMVKVTLSSFSLPFNNFAIETKSETCGTKNNGQIIITATQSYNYTVKINGENYNFVNNGLTVPDLAPGVYTFCIGVTGKTFEQCYSVTIGKGGSITGKSSVSSNKALVEITSGTAPFEIVVNGTSQFETSENNFSVGVKQGDLLEIKTSVACEGIYSTNILDGLIGVIIHPNPTAGFFEITIPTSKTEVEIELYSISSQLISKRKYPVINQRVQLSLEKEPNGIYFAKLNLDSPLSLTIIKKS